MAAYFLDSSALVKRYARETGTAWMLSLFRTGARHRLYVSRITGVEVAAALTRKLCGGQSRQERRRAHADAFVATSPCNFALQKLRQ